MRPLQRVVHQGGVAIEGGVVGEVMGTLATGMEGATVVGMVGGEGTPLSRDMGEWISHEDLTVDELCLTSIICRCRGNKWLHCLGSCCITLTGFSLSCSYSQGYQVSVYYECVQRGCFIVDIVKLQ